MAFKSLFDDEELLLEHHVRAAMFTYPVPLDDTHLVMVRGLIHQDISPKCVKEESSTERRSYKRQVNRSPQL